MKKCYHITLTYEIYAEDIKKADSLIIETLPFVGDCWKIGIEEVKEETPKEELQE